MYFLNLVVLQPGEAVYMAANEPHAYLAGAFCLNLCISARDVQGEGGGPVMVHVKQTSRAFFESTCT